MTEIKYDNDSYKALEGFETPETKAFEYALDISYEVYKAMQEQGITQKKLADTMGITPGRLSQLLNMQSNLTLKTIARFEMALGITLINVSKPTKINLTVHDRTTLSYSDIWVSNSEVSSLRKTSAGVRIITLGTDDKLDGSSNNMSVRAEEKLCMA